MDPMMTPNCLSLRTISGEEFCTGSDDIGEGDMKNYLLLEQ